MNLPHGFGQAEDDPELSWCVKTRQTPVTLHKKIQVRNPNSEIQKTLKTESFFKTQWQQNLTWLELTWWQDLTIYSLYSSYLVWIFMHFARKILMCLITECFPRPCWSCYITQGMCTFLHSENFWIQKTNVWPQGFKLKEYGLIERICVIVPWMLRAERKRRG